MKAEKNVIILHQVRAQNMTVGVFPEIRAGRSVLFSGVRSAAWGSTAQHGEHRIQGTASCHMYRTFNPPPPEMWM